MSMTKAKWASARARFAADPDSFTHGVRHTYLVGCRCPRCCHANAAYHRRRPKSHMPSIRDDITQPKTTGDLTARRNDPPPSLATPRARPVYGCDCGAVFTDRRDIANHTCAA